MTHVQQQEIDMNDSAKLGLRKTARIQNLATGTYLERIEFKTSSKKRALIELPPSTVSEPPAIREAFA